MFQKFINRDEESAYLDREYRSDKFSLTVIYGRRRVGKTELIGNFLKDKPNIYFLADKRGTRSNLYRFRKKAADFLKDYEPNLETFDEVFEYINTKWSGGKKLVVVIDEFSYLAQMDESIPSVFQLIVDEILKNRTFHLILCGSSISMMEKSTLAHSSPLYGRRTGQIEVKPMLFRNVGKFFPGMSRDEIVNIYGATGGVPFYLLFFNPEYSFYENLSNTFFSKEAILYAEGEFLLREELKEPATFMNILLAISKGATRPGEIASRSYLEAKDLPYYLDTIIKLGFVRKEHPVLEKPTTKKTIYRIEDNFLRFWFRFVLSHKDELEQGNKESAIGNVEKSYDAFLGETFEQIGKEMLIYLNSRGGLPFRFQKLGRQWGKIPMAPKGQNEYEIDIVAVNDDTKEILFCECKWESRKVDIDVYRRLVEKAGYVKWHHDRKEYFAITSRSGFTDMMKKEAQMKGVLLLTLGDYMPHEFEALVKGVKIAKKRKIKEDEVDKIVHRHRKVEASSIKYYEKQLNDLEKIPTKLAESRDRRLKKAKEIQIEINKLADAYRELYAPVHQFIKTHPLARDKFHLNFEVEVVDTGFQDKFFSQISRGVAGTFCGVNEGEAMLKSILHRHNFNSETGIEAFLNEIFDSLMNDKRPGGGDKELHQLSPGERGTLLLVFYLLIDKDDIPLVIDQPEENLDNQTVFELLVPSIKEAKGRRQIFIVTHNPNLAVVCDAEQIISPSLDKQGNYKMDYLSGAIENPQINKAVVDILEGTRPAFNNRESKYLVEN